MKRIESGIEFGVKFIETPEPRDYVPVNCETDDAYYRLECFTMEFIREEFKNRTLYDLPPVEGNWDLAKTWVENMWDAMYNPLWMRKYEPPNKRGWNYGVFDGHHRLRLFDALDANHIWAYVQNVKHFEKPSWVKPLLQANLGAPRQGTHSGSCEHCGKTRVRYKVLPKPNHRLMGGKLTCGECGGEIPYPWAGVL